MDFYSDASQSPFNEGRPRSESSLNCYSILSVNPEATRLQIREAYLRLKNAYGPGSAALYSLLSDEEAAQTLERIEQAYRILNDDRERRIHDARLGLAGASAGGELPRPVATRAPAPSAERPHS